jgi:hypothetical protein
MFRLKHPPLGRLNDTGRIVAENIGRFAMVRLKNMESKNLCQGVFAFFLLKNRRPQGKPSTIRHIY